MNCLKHENKIILLSVEENSGFLLAALGLFDSHLSDRPYTVTDGKINYQIELPPEAIAVKGRCKIYHPQFKILEKCYLSQPNPTNPTSSTSATK